MSTAKQKKAAQAGGKNRERTRSSRLMPNESPQNPQPDDLPENQRTGDEPNPSERAPAPNAPAATNSD